MTNGKVERTFSRLKLIKTNLRCSLTEDHLDDAVRIAVDGPPLSQWDASGAVNLWWNDRQRRQVSDSRKQPSTYPSTTEAERSETCINLDAWEQFLSEEREEEELEASESE